MHAAAGRASPDASLPTTSPPVADLGRRRGLGLDTCPPAPSSFAHHRSSRPPSDCDTGVPARCTPAGRKMDRLDGNAASGYQPGYDRVGVPHLPDAELVTAPHQRRNIRHALPQPPRDTGIVAQPPGTLDRLLDIGDDAVTPPPDLVPEDPHASSPTRTHRPLGDHPSPSSARVRNRRLLDYKAPAVRKTDDQR